MLRAVANGSKAGGRFIFCEEKTTSRMIDFRVKSNGRIQAVAEDGTPLGGEFTFHYTFFRAYGEDGNTLLSKLPSNGEKKKNQMRLENVRRLMARAIEHELPYTFHLMVPRVHDRCITRLVPVEHADGLATKVQVCNGDTLPFTNMLETKKVWHCIAKLYGTSTSVMASPLASAAAVSPAAPPPDLACFPPAAPSMPTLVHDPFPAHMVVVDPAQTAEAEAEAETEAVVRTLRSRVIHSPPIYKKLRA